MIEQVVILPDVHLEEHEIPTSYQLTKKLIADIHPDEVLLLGDFIHLSSLSHWIYDKKKLCENRRYLKEIDTANKELDFLQKHSKRVTYMEGNHEQWVTFYIEFKPEVEGLLELKKLLRLKERGIRWVPINKLYKIGKMYFIHGLYIYKYHAFKHLTSYGCCITYGHTHTAQTAQMNMKMQEPIMAYGLGCLCDHEPDYRRGKPSNWIDQFAIMYHDTTCGNFNLYPVNITKNQFIWNRKIYAGV